MATLLIGCKEKKRFPVVESLNNKSQTEFITTLEQDFDIAKNQIYCSTLLYAWNEIREELNNEISITDSFKDLKILNSSESYKKSLAKDEIETSVVIEDELIRASAWFEKSLPFEFNFKRNNSELLFNEEKVESFGVNGYDYEISPQVRILYYKNDQDFAIKLAPKDNEHELLLVMSPEKQKKSFIDLYKNILADVGKYSVLKRDPKHYWKFQIMEDDTLSIPVVSYHLETKYKELEGNKFIGQGTRYSVEEAYQRIAFILDEKGAQVESEAVMKVIAEAIVEELPKPKKLVFNRPFLIFLKRIDSFNPYLAMWIANDELMINK